MMTILVSFIVMLLVFTGMAIGVLYGRPSLRGTCGGLNRVKGLKGSCLACAGTCKREHKRANRIAEEGESEHA